MIGLGNDIIEIGRIRKSVDHHGHRLISRLFTIKEQDYCFKHNDPIPRFAGRFAAKEAIVKALGTGFGKHVGWQDIEILNNESGRPFVRFSENVNNHFKNPEMLLSISHCELYAIATAIWIK